jgi:hypothetical protein
LIHGEYHLAISLRGAPDGVGSQIGCSKWHGQSPFLLNGIV